MWYIKNPLNYQWGKFKLFDQIFPLFPKIINTFVDLFGWSGEVGLNCESNKLIYNEKSNWVFEILQEMKTNKNFIEQVDQYIAKYDLSKTNKDWFLKARSDYNNSFVKDPILLYVLVCHSFTNMMSFNKNQEFNMPFWARTFNINMRKNLQKYLEIIPTKNIDILSNDFKDFNIDWLSTNDFVYIDPPYLITVWGYERDFFCKWSVERERVALIYRKITQKMSKICFEQCVWTQRKVKWFTQRVVQRLQCAFTWHALLKL